MTDRDIDSLVLGSVVRTGRGGERVVRAISKSPPSPMGRGVPRMSVTFAIKHRSWTGRAYTVVDRNDLRQQRYQPTGVTVSLTNEADRWFARCLAVERAPGAPREPGFTPEAVRGWP